MKTWVSRVVLVAAAGNFATMIWFAQFITTGWIIYCYVTGSFAALCTAMIVGK